MRTKKEKHEKGNTYDMVEETNNGTKQNDENKTKLKLQMFEKTDADTYRNIDALRNDINHKSMQTIQNHHNKR